MQFSTYSYKLQKKFLQDTLQHISIKNLFTETNSSNGDKI